MGYEANSPIKQVWLPIDYQFIANHKDLTFKRFSELYKEKYGIELHDIFGLFINGGAYSVITKNDLTGGYAVGGFQNLSPMKLATPNAIFDFTYELQQSTSNQTLMTIAVGSRNSNQAFGFSIILPTESEVQVQNIDDLKIDAFEI